MLEKAYDNYTNVNHGYDELYGYYVTYIEDMVPTLLNEDFMWNFSSSGQYGMAPNIGTGMKCKCSPFHSCKKLTLTM